MNTTPSKRDHDRQRRVAIGSLIVGAAVVAASAILVRIWPELRPAALMTTKTAFLTGLGAVPLAAIARRVFPRTVGWMMLVTTIGIAMVIAAATAFAFLARPAV